MSEEETYWISTWGESGNDRVYGTLATDSDDYIYVAGQRSVNGGDILLSKYSNDGGIQWQRTLGGSSTESVNGAATDSNNNVYVICATASAGAGGYDWFIAKYNSSGAIQWQRTLGGSSNEFVTGVTTDSGNNVYVVGFTESAGAGNRDALIVKYNSSGTLQWQRTLGGSSDDYARAVATDSNDNVYVAGETASTGAGEIDLLIAKYNSSGTLQWQRTLGGSGYDYARAIAIDSNDNVYVAGDTGSSDAFIAKYNSSGTIQWQRTLSGSNNDVAHAVTVDSSDNVYILANTQSAGAGEIDLLISKYNSSGTLQWQRTLGGSSWEDGRGITTDSNDNVYVAGHTFSTGAGSNDFLVAKLSNDGTGTGTYGPFTYAASTLTDSASSLTDAASSLTDSAATLTDSASSLTDTAIVTYTALED